MKAFDPEEHRAVLDAAMRLFEKHPLRDITLDKLAKASGVPAFDILRHFQSTENILRAVLERELEMMAASAQAPELRMPGRPSRMNCESSPALFSISTASGSPSWANS
jgi:AcrR family transcriptional regulator